MQPHVYVWVEVAQWLECWTINQEDQGSSPLLDYQARGPGFKSTAGLSSKRTSVQVHCVTINQEDQCSSPLCDYQSRGPGFKSTAAVSKLG